MEVWYWSIYGPKGERLPNYFRLDFIGAGVPYLHIAHTIERERPNAIIELWNQPFDTNGKEELVYRCGPPDEPPFRPRVTAAATSSEATS